jgi:predicted nucleic acid-binding protein
MKIFLDSSALLAACGSKLGASREIIRRADVNSWILIATPYVTEEVEYNISDLPPTASSDWGFIQKALTIMPDVLTLDRPVVFEPSKDRPILFGALAWADVLVTLDQHDFGGLMRRPVYGLRILRPGDFLSEERAAGRLA